jgi:hypothetical protein
MEAAATECDHALTIVQSVIVGATVVITLASDPGAGKVIVRYAIARADSGCPHGLLRDSDEYVGYDAEDIDVQLTSGSTIATSVVAGSLLRRTGFDVVTGLGVPADTIVARQNTSSSLTLSAPWSGATGPATLSFRHDERNWCVHFVLTEA